MPMSRYEIRNEYSLADPELYRAADKDDPEALLEGVAMAGLVGVLRQLGDLAEFAAEIFHDLHEEMLVTASRGNGLMVRVQQLEAEVPSIEKAFLSQTDHSSYFHNAGVNWHPKPRLDQNLVTQGDLPRFVMDSYEECRGPPRLFLLDKFDVAGAGSCLKRYTDPSFFKVETSAMTEAAVHREKKNRKAKKRGQRWRNGGTPEVVPISHARLHQLLQEEPVENGVSKATRRVKLKRRPHFSPFDSNTGGSYMEKLLKTPSPEHQTLRELTVSSPLRLSTNDRFEVDLEALEPRSISRAGENVEIKRGLPPDREEIMQKHLIYETNDVSGDDKIYEVPSYLEIVKDGIPSTFDEDTGEKDIQADEENKAEVYLTDYHSDEVSSEIDNYVDAPSTIESGMDTDSELRVKNDFISSIINSQQMVSVRNEEHIPSLSSDSHSTGDLVISDDGNSQQWKIMSGEEMSTVDIPKIAIADASSYQKTVDKFLINQLPQPVVFDITCIDKDAPTDSATTLPQYDSGVVTKDTSREPKSDEKAHISDEEEKKINLIMDFPCSPSVSDSNSQSGNDSDTFTSGEHLVEEPNHDNAPSLFTVSGSLCHTEDSSATVTTHLMHEENCDHNKDLNDFENTTSTLNTSIVLSKSKIDNVEMIPTDNSVSGELGDDVPKLTEKGTTSKITIEEKLNEMLDNEGLEVLSDASNHSSRIVEASLGKEITETSSVEAIDAKDLHSDSPTDNQISSETLISPPIEFFPDLLETDLDAHGTVFIPEDVTKRNKLGYPKYCEVVEVQRTGMTYDAKANYFLVLESSSCTPENLENPEGKSDIAENNDIEHEKDVSGQEVTEMSSYEDSKSPNEVHELLVKSDFKTDHQSKTGVMASSVTAAVSDSDVRENVNLPVDLDNLVNEHISCFDGSCIDELENEKKSLLEGHESGLVDEVGVHNDNLKLEVSHTYPTLYLDSAADTTKLQSPQEQSGIENQVSDSTSFPVYCHTEETMLERTEVPPNQIDQESYPNSYLDFSVDTTQVQSPMEQSSIDNQVFDVTSFPVNCDTEETMLERTELSPDQIDQEFSDSGERSSELSSPLPINQQQILDHDEHKGDENAGPPLTLVNCPLSVSGLPEIRNYDINISGYPNKDPSGFISPPSNPFSEPSQIDMDELPPLPPLPPVQWRMGKHPQALSATEDEMIKHKELFPQRSDTCVLLEETNYSLNQVVSETKSEEEKIVQSSSSLEDNPMHEAIHLPLKEENEQPEFALPAPESEVTSAAEESESVNETQTAKLPRPSNPLIESIAVLDKSKLRKVAERVRPQIQKVDDRDSLLEQIRTKSFNLKPPVASRPSIQGSQTNINVAAILEKVNAFRQAFAGSDEDDEDNWSDS